MLRIVQGYLLFDLCLQQYVCISSLHEYLLLRLSFQQLTRWQHKANLTSSPLAPSSSTLAPHAPSASPPPRDRDRARRLVCPLGTLSPSTVPYTVTIKATGAIPVAVAPRAPTASEDLSTTATVQAMRQIPLPLLLSLLKLQMELRPIPAAATPGDR